MFSHVLLRDKLIHYLRGRVDINLLELNVILYTLTILSLYDRQQLEHSLDYLSEMNLISELKISLSYAD